MPRERACGMIVVPAEALPRDKAQRHAFLRNYFCDIDAKPIEEKNGTVVLELYWPDELARHVDPGLDNGLSALRPPVPRHGMYAFHRREGRVLTALFDTWTLYAWSEWLAGNHEPTQGIVILHVDDHKDIGSPRVRWDKDRWVDMISGNPLDIRRPDSIQAAIQTGALGMGSFLTFWLHAFPNSEVRHLCQPPKATITQDFRIELGTELDTFLQPGAQRPVTTLIPDAGTGPGKYRITPAVNDWLAALPEAAHILVHIDMDYFNNRYDGDSDWESRAEPLNPSQELVAQLIDDVGLALAQMAKIERVAVAFSPGFFPAEYWNLAEQKLRDRLRHLYHR